VPPLDAQSLPREVTWNPELQQLCYAPLEEQAELRLAPPLATPTGPLVLGPNTAPYVLGPWAGSVGNQSEVQISFALPSAPATFGLVVMGGSDVASSGTLFFVDFTLPSSLEDDAAPVWPRTVTVGAMTNRTAATRRGNFNCATMGVTCYNDTLQLTERDSNITLRAFVDGNVAECYWQDNRVASFVEAPPTVEAFVAIFSTGGAAQKVESVEAWQVGDIWISPEELLATPRADGRVLQ
jgi:hypothetical protein